jgi:hypothetical protein
LEQGVTVIAYKPRRIVNPFEKEVYAYLSSALEKSSEEYLLFGPLRMGRRELDGLVIGQGFMVALEVKAVKGHVSMGANTPVTVKTEEGEVVGFQERYEDPYDQAEKHWKELGSFIRNVFGETGFWFTSMLVFEPGSTFGVPSQARDAHSLDSLIVALDEVPDYLRQLSTRYNKTNLTEEQQAALIKALTDGIDKLSEAEKNIFAPPSTLDRETRPPYAPPPPSPKVSPAIPEKRIISDDAGIKIQAPRKPWVQSPWFLWFAFFFLNPVWAFLMLKDQRRSWFVKLVATVFLLVQLLACLGVVYLVQTCPQCFGIEPTVTTRSSTPSPDMPSRSNTPDPASAPSVPTETSPDTESACTITWVETSAEGLANKNRAMVWEQTIRAWVAGSGMTDRQFYDQVVERNPALQKDGYVFLEGKTYSLPQCE